MKAGVGIVRRFGRGSTWVQTIAVDPDFTPWKTTLGVGQV
jgi:hypothetical protein